MDNPAMLVEQHDERPATQGNGRTRSSKFGQMRDVNNLQEAFYEFNSLKKNG